MQFWRSPLRFCLSLLLGIALVSTLHACLPGPTASTVAGTPSASEIEISDTSPSSDPALSPEDQTNTPQLAEALPPETEAILATAGSEGVYNPPRKDVRLVVISDLNGAYGSTDYDPEIDKAITLLPFWQPDMVLCSGDMVAGQKTTLTDSQLQAMWAAFDDHVAGPLRQANIPYGFTMGNHDASGSRTSSGGFVFARERTIASDYWNDPSHNPGIEFVDRSDYPFYYSFKLNDVFFVAWDGSTYQIPPEKLAWVEQAFNSPEAQSAQIKMLIGHLPLYGVAVGRNKPGEVMANADQLRNMLEQNGVHTYISGHQHAYYPAHRGQLQLLHTGLLGSGPRTLVGTQTPSKKSLTVVDIDFASPELTTYTTYDMQSLELIELEQLPRYIPGHNGLVLRRDIEQEDLTSAEQNDCASQIGAALCSSS